MDILLGILWYLTTLVAASSGDERCVAGEKRCKDGRCVGIWDSCDGPQDVKCPWGQKLCDGRCMTGGRNCDGKCPKNQKLCGNGCVPEFYTCLHVARPCSSLDDGHSCDNGYECYTDAERCDGFPDCIDEADEVGCSGNKGQALSFLVHHWYLFLILIVVAAMIWVTYFCWKNRKRQSDAYLIQLNLLRQQNTSQESDTGQCPPISQDSSPFIEQCQPSIPTQPPSYEETMSRPPCIPSAPPSYSEAVDDRLLSPPLTA